MTTSFPVVLRQCRVSAGLSQGALARSAGLAPANLCRLESPSSAREPGLELLRRLALVLGRPFVLALFGLGESGMAVEQSPAMPDVSIELRGVRVVGLDSAGRQVSPSSAVPDVSTDRAAGDAPKLELRRVPACLAPRRGSRPCTPAAHAPAERLAGASAGRGLEVGAVVGGRRVTGRLGALAGKDVLYGWICDDCGQSGQGAAFNLRRTHVCRRASQRGAAPAPRST